MTDKQIIDKERMFECVWCRYDFKESDANFILSENPNECVCNGCITEWADNLLCDFKRKEQELQEAMDNYVKLDNQRVKEYNELVDKYNNKEQECEELKKEREKKRDHYFMISNENARLEDEKSRLGYGLNCKIEKLKQTLTEIKEIAEEKAKVNDWLALDILQKINECEIDNG